MHQYGTPGGGGYQPVATSAGSRQGKPAALVGLIAAALYAVGVFLPYVSGSGVSASLADGGKEVYAIFFIPAAVGVIAALRSLTSGSITAAGIAAGTAVGAFGVAQFFVAIFYRTVSEAGGGVSYGVGFYCHAGAVVLALAAVMMGQSLPRTDLDSRRPLNAVVCTLGGLAFIGAGAAILLPENGYSVFDIPDGVIKSSAIAWGVVSPAAGLFAALSRVRARVGFAAGVAVGHLGVVVGLSIQNTNSGSGINTGFGVSNEGLYNISVVASALLVGVALLMNTQEGVPSVAASSGFGYQAASASSAQWAADPFGRHQLRYFDGQQWTASVSDNGAVSVDPPTATPSPSSGFNGPPTSGFTAPTSGFTAPPTSGFTTPTSPPPGAPMAGKRCSMGHENGPGSVFCTTCGARLDG